MRTVIATLSAINVVAGVGLLALAALLEAPLLVVAIGVGMISQGGYTLLYVAGTLQRWTAISRQLLLVGSTLALAVGGVAFTQSILYNIQPPNDDPEYGPMSMAFLITVHAVAVLSRYAFNLGAPPRRSASTG